MGLDLSRFPVFFAENPYNFQDDQRYQSFWADSTFIASFFCLPFDLGGVLCDSTHAPTSKGVVDG